MILESTKLLELDWQVSSGELELFSSGNNWTFTAEHSGIIGLAFIGPYQYFLTQIPTEYIIAYYFQRNFLILSQNPTCRQEF